MGFGFKCQPSEGETRTDMRLAIKVLDLLQKNCRILSKQRMPKKKPEGGVAEWIR